MNDDGGGRPPAQYWPASPAGSSWQPGPPEPLIDIPERRPLRTAGICIVVGVLGLAAIVTFRSVTHRERNAGPAHTITLPASVARYDRLIGSAADRTVESMRQAARNSAGDSVDASIPDSADIAVYEDKADRRRRFVFIGITAGADPEIGKELRSHSASHEADEILHGEGDFSGEHDYAAGPLGGVLRCGDGTADSGPVTVCVWVDGSTVGMFLAPRMSDEALAGTALDFRNAAEH